MEQEFPRSISVTFNGSQLKSLFPEELPIFYMFSLRHGISDKPWFLPPISQAESHGSMNNPACPFSRHQHRGTGRHYDRLQCARRRRYRAHCRFWQPSRSERQRKSAGARRRLNALTSMALSKPYRRFDRLASIMNLSPSPRLVLSGKSQIFLNIWKTRLQRAAPATSRCVTTRNSRRTSNRSPHSAISVRIR